ncbi:hypothetical protein JB92DRAFT_763716 [Gautieria morchelliformis]|nr:hypothetical protein JB92DRAFT_763716 [Gautieria morchelliformis]
MGTAPPYVAQAQRHSALTQRNYFVGPERFNRPGPSHSRNFPVYAGAHADTYFHASPLPGESFPTHMYLPQSQPHHFGAPSSHFDGANTSGFAGHSYPGHVAALSLPPPYDGNPPVADRAGPTPSGSTLELQPTHRRHHTA